ncbi:MULTISPECIES: hypothetical protein [unclassified Oleiphilus]|uniref:hypothetical protein n=1 Tax=unclassified Oleiphilus TaxID=2631174 RepID=UPI0018D3389A|nr:MULTISPECIES: hypothetical protein [unclassified Oleiphilus]
MGPIVWELDGPIPILNNSAHAINKVGILVVGFSLGCRWVVAALLNAIKENIVF